MIILTGGEMAYTRGEGLVGVAGVVEEDFAAELGAVEVDVDLGG